MAAVFTWFWLWQVDLGVATIVLVGGALIAMPLALQETAGQAASARTVTITKRSLILSISALVVFVALYSMRGENFTMLTAVCVMLPLVLAASRAWGVRRGRIELGLLRHRCVATCGLIWSRPSTSGCAARCSACLLAVGGAHFARVGYSLNTAQFNVVMVAFAAGLVVWPRWWSSLDGVSTWPRMRSWPWCRASSFCSSSRSPFHPPTRSPSTRR